MLALAGIELIFLRLVEHEMRIRSESEPGSAFTDVEKQKLVSVLNNVNSVEQVCLTRPFYPVSKHLMNGYLAKNHHQEQVSLQILPPI